jgi:hypothetical protein
VNIKVFTVLAVVGVEEPAAGSGERKCQETGQVVFVGLRVWTVILVVKQGQVD